ncbi:unnamed protein product [Parajaminaea phylloscopi]
MSSVGGAHHRATAVRVAVYSGEVLLAGPVGPHGPSDARSEPSADVARSRRSDLRLFERVRPSTTRSDTVLYREARDTSSMATSSRHLLRGPSIRLQSSSAQPALSTLRLQSCHPCRLPNTPRLPRFASTKSNPSVSTAIQDEKIRARQVRLINPETGAMMPDAVNPQDILRQIDRQRFFLLQVAEARQDMLPVCKIVSKKEAFTKAKSKQKAQVASTTANNQKKAEVQLSWLVTPYDLSHKLKQAKRHLMKRGKGSQIEVIIVTRKDRGLASRNEAAKKQLLEDIDQEFTGNFDAESASETAQGSDGSGGQGLKARRKKDVEWRDNQARAVVVYEAY